MGKARIALTGELVKQWLQLPSEWQLYTAYVDHLPYLKDESRDTLYLVFEGENIEAKEPPIELRGMFHQRVIDNASDDMRGRWVQGHWEIFR